MQEFNTTIKIHIGMKMCHQHMLYIYSKTRFSDDDKTNICVFVWSHKQLEYLYHYLNYYMGIMKIAIIYFIFIFLNN